MSKTYEVTSAFYHAAIKLQCAADLYMAHPQAQDCRDLLREALKVFERARINDINTTHGGTNQ